MTRDEVLEMARQAGFRVALINSIEGDEVIGQGDNGVIVTDELERFAALVADRTRQETCKEDAKDRRDYLRAMSPG